MGSAEFAVPALEALERKGYDITAVVTQPDRIRGRGGRVLPTPVGLYAENAGMLLLKPEKLKGNEEFADALERAAPDLIVTAAYGKILPKSVLETPTLGCVNIHASLLPEYRGAAPIQRAILDGKRETGVTLMHVVEKLDAGDVIVSARADVSGMDAGELTGTLARLGAELLTDTLPAIADGTAPRSPQDETMSSYAEKIEKSEGRIDFGETADRIALRIRAMTPAPGAYLMKGDERIGVTAAKAAGPGEISYSAYETALPGTVLDVSKQGVAIRAGEGVIIIEAIKMPGKKAMPVAEYLKGNMFDVKSF